MTDFGRLLASLVVERSLVRISSGTKLCAGSFCSHFPSSKLLSYVCYLFDSLRVIVAKQRFGIPDIYFIKLVYVLHILFCLTQKCFFSYTNYLPRGDQTADKSNHQARFSCGQLQIVLRYLLVCGIRSQTCANNPCISIALCLRGWYWSENGVRSKIAIDKKVNLCLLPCKWEK